MPEPVLNILQIRKILPHRYPFLLVDKVLELDLENNFIIAQKNVSANEEFFQGHFPSVPLMPGVLLLEALAQTGGILVHQKGYTNKIPVFINIVQAKFRHPVKPGDVLILEAKGIHVSSKGGKFEVKARIDDQVAVEGLISFALVELDQI